MSKVSPLVDGLIEAMQCLPGVGPKSAQRMVLHLLERNRDGGIVLAEIMAKAIEGVGQCKKCRIFTESEFCSICSNEKRDKSNICVVESVSDVFAIEQSNQFNGNYFILHGHLSPIDGVGPGELGMNILDQRLQEDGITEVIIATNSTVEGDATAHYVAEMAAEYQISASRIAHGIPLGGELEYSDSGTLSHAFYWRRTIE